MFGNPIPAPNPISRISGSSRRVAFLHCQIDVRDARPLVLDAKRDRLRC